ncbi:glycosyltransferase family 2 protein [Thermomicrobium sp. 4228-Ro]|uniref:glycosyltransferase family 2 protein n=1 Tax=Thermomicrobium sp. 4228-Ro TaxID=2993937 RepID=UPI0022488A27|nr:glycosyltransferase family 2 protein [Thermomicrobium sp. 4228-Ro]MCX2726261.1 glycosyltransferase family 2 protein [Thermomicrobium sp. 4228-Ro]
MREQRVDGERAGVLPVRGSLSLVLPAYNEAANLEAVVRRALAVLPELVERFEIIIVDDGSRDGTDEIAERLAREDQRIRVVHHPVNRGYGAALRSGFAASHGELVMFMDADQQFDPADFAHLAPFLPHADIVAGYRVRRRDPWIRLVYAALFNAAMRLLFGITVRDIDCAFKVLRGDLVRALDLRMNGALVNTELLAKAQRAGATIVEVGVHHYPRLSGEPSGGSVRVILRAMREVLQLWWLLLWYRPPQGLGRGRPQPRSAQVVRAGALALLGLSAAWWMLRRFIRKDER